MNLIARFVALLFLLQAAAVSAAAPRSIFDDDWVPPKASDTPRTVPAKPATSPSVAPPVKPEPPVVAPKPVVPAPAKIVGRRDIPAKADQAASRKVLREVFAEQLADPSIPGRRKLTESLLTMAEKSADSPVDQFVLLVAAMDAGAEAVNLPLAFRAIDRLAKGFDVDGLPLKGEIAAKLSPKPGAADLAEENAKAAMTVVDQLAAEEDFVTASKICAAIAPLAAKNPALRTEIQFQQRELTLRREAAEKFALHNEKLKASPEDPAANLEVGRYLCFYRWNWKAGLVNLTHGSDQTLRAIAERELASAETTEAQSALADAWWDQASTMSGISKTAIEWHAAEWYAKAKPKLKGLSRAKAEKRIAATGYVSTKELVAAADENIATPAVTPKANPGEWRALFDGKSLDGWRNWKQQTIKPDWKAADGAMVKGSGGGNLATIEELDFFELTIDYKIAPGGNSGILFWVQDEGGEPAQSGPEVQLLDNERGNDPIKSGWLCYLLQPSIDPKTGKALDATRPAGEWNQVRLVVAPAGQTSGVWMNGVKYEQWVFDSADWKQTVANSKFGNSALFAKRQKGHIVLQDHGAAVSFREIKIRELPATKASEPPRPSAAKREPAPIAKPEIKVDKGVAGAVKLTPQQTTKHFITEEERLAVKAADSAEVEIDAKWDRLDEGVAMVSDERENTAGEIPMEFRGRPFTRLTAGQGKTTFKVVRDGVVLMACTDRWGKGGNSSGNWKPELTTRAELERQGWSEVAILPLTDKKMVWIVFKRACKAGETFTYRTEKYNPPLLIQ